MNKEDALKEIALLAKKFNLTWADIKNALAPGSRAQLGEYNQLINTLLAYVGGILIFAGLCIFIGMEWESIRAPARIGLTLGVGFCLFVIALFFSYQVNYQKSSLPLFTIAAILQPAGLVVLFIEYYPALDPLHGLLLINTLLLIQQGLAFLILRRTELLFFTLLFGVLFFTTGFEILEVGFRTEWMAISTSLLFLSWSVEESSHRALAPFLFFVSSFIFLLISFDLVQDKPYEILYLGISCLMIFVAIAIQCRTLLINATIASLAYIGYFTGIHFSNTLGWPITLMLMGSVLIGFSALVFRVNRHYTQDTSKC